MTKAVKTLMAKRDGPTADLRPTPWSQLQLTDGATALCVTPLRSTAHPKRHQPTDQVSARMPPDLNSTGDPTRTYASTCAFDGVLARRIQEPE